MWKMKFLKNIYNKYGFNRALIETIISGDKYLAVLLKNRQIGVCATLGYQLPSDIGNNFQPNFSLPFHRILYIAYLNAVINSESDKLHDNDIFDQVDFTSYQNIVMVGQFLPLIDKFKKNDIHVNVFDINKEGPEFRNMDLQEKYLNGADALILTSTSLLNNTFENIISATHSDSNVFMLGPSSILTEEFFGFSQIKMIFGSLFEKNDKRVLNLIANGGGTRDFLPYIRKVFINRSDYETT